MLNNGPLNTIQELRKVFMKFQTPNKANEKNAIQSKFVMNFDQSVYTMLYKNISNSECHLVFY
jgi:hypothetical protein